MQATVATDAIALQETALQETDLKDLFRAIAQASTETVLRQDVMNQLGEYFSANRQASFFTDELPAMEEQMPLMMQRALTLDNNPVLRYLVQRHAAVHDEVILPPGVWRTLCPRADHGHVMVGPIIQTGQLVGGIAFTRHRDEPAFDADNLADLGALCLHFSSQLTVVRVGVSATVKTNSVSRQQLLGEQGKHPLTPREMEIATLVAQGLTNKKIGVALWITENSVKQALKRMYRKLKVSSRAEMVTQLWVDQS
ncbi:MAG: helix-turn-helix transcriptional regulator [Cyanobacteria bacterium P01_F01_bin.53]